VDASPDGRLLVSVGPEGAHFWDLATGADIPSLQLPGARSAVFDQASGDLLTNSSSGLQRWPVLRADALRVGPPRTLLPAGSHWGPISPSPDGRSLIVRVAADEAVVLHADRPAQPVRLKGHSGLWNVAVSPDGRWAATAPWEAREIRLWDAQSGQLIRHLPGSESVDRATVAFSPDSRWLVAGTAREYRFWQVETGKPGLRIAKEETGDTPGQLAFSRDGALLAIQHSLDLVKLVDARSGAELARFASPSSLGMPAPSLCFSADGSQLIVGDDRKQIHVWDVRLIRARLAEMRLDWDLPPYPPPRPPAAEGSLAGMVLCDASEVRNFHGHSNGENGVAFSPDGRYGLSSGWDGKDGFLRLWDLETGKEQRRFLGHTRSVWCMAFSPDGRRILSGGKDLIVRLWDVDTGKELRQFKGNSNDIWGVVFCPDGRHALSCAGTPDNSLRLWDIESGNEVRRLTGHRSGIWSIALSRDGRYVLSGSNEPEHVVCVWSVETGKQIARFQGHRIGARCVAISPDGGRAVSGDLDGSLFLWDVNTAQELRRFVGHTQAVMTVAFSPDGRYALSGSQDRTIRLWDVETGLELRQWQAHFGQTVHGVAFSADGRRALSVGGDGALRLWDMTAREGPAPDLVKYTHAIAQNPKDAAAHQQLAWILATERDPRHRDIKRAIELARKAVELAPQDGDCWRSLGVAHYRAGDWKAALEALDRSGQFRKESDGISYFFLAMTHWRLGHDEQARDWHRRAVRWMEGREASDELRRFRTEAAGMLPDAAEIRSIVGHSKEIMSVAYCNDGRRAVSGSFDNTMRLWDVATGKELRRFEGHQAVVHSVALSPDNRQVLSGSWDGSIRLWDVETAKEVRRFQGSPGVVLTVALSPDGRQALSGAGNGDHSTRLWDVATGKEIRRFEGHTGEIHGVAFSPDGHRALSGASDRTVRLWEVATGKEIRRFDGHGDGLVCVAFSPDGRRALSGAFY
jgi:WD40 repeat protein